MLRVAYRHSVFTIPDILRNYFYWLKLAGKNKYIGLNYRCLINNLTVHFYVR